MNAPTLYIVLPLEGAPRVFVDAATDGQEARLQDWISADPKRAGIVREAIALEAEERAA